MAKGADSARRIIVFALDGAFSLDVLGSLEIFQVAARLQLMRRHKLRADPTDAHRFEGYTLPYDVELVGPRKGRIDTASGPLLFATRALSRVTDPVDTLIVAGGSVRQMMAVMAKQPALADELRRLAANARRVASVCTGSFLLASAGLLDGRRATTHWAACALLQKRYPRLKVESDPIYTQDGKFYTSAGATTGMDLSLALVREDHGRELAHEVARWLVLYMQRPAGQAQLSVQLRAQEAERQPLRDLQVYIAEHPHADLSVESLAARVGMSVRNFARAFRREVWMTPAAYVEAVRVEAARRKLELGSASVEEIAALVGFGSVETLRRAFARQVGMSPSAYRNRLFAAAQ